MESKDNGAIHIRNGKRIIPDRPFFERVLKWRSLRRLWYLMGVTSHSALAFGVFPTNDTLRSLLCFVPQVAWLMQRCQISRIRFFKRD